MGQIRLAVVLAVIALFAGNGEAKTVRYKDADNGLLGSMQRAGQGKVSFAHLANIISLVMHDNNLNIGDLRRLRAGRQIIIRNRYLQLGFRPRAAQISASRRVLNSDSALRRSDKQLVQRFAQERKDYERKIEDLRQKFRAQEENARLLVRNAEAVERDLAAKLRDAMRSRDKAAQEVHESQQRSVRQPLAQGLQSAWGGKVMWLGVGFLGALFAAWVWFRLIYREQNIIYAKVLWAKAPNGERKKFTFDVKRAGYTCEECVRKSQGAAENGGRREQGVGIQAHNLAEHLAKTRAHLDLWVIKAA